MTAPVPDWLAGATSSRLVDSLQRTRTPVAAPDGQASPRPAAVLLLLGPGGLGSDPVGPEAATVLLTRRTTTLRAHAGQVAFPGGRREPGDVDAPATALREAAEEVRLDAGGVEVVAQLPPVHIIPSNHRVTPVLAWWSEPSPLRADGVEVESVAVVPLTVLAEPAHRVTMQYPGGGSWPAFDLPGGFLVWGFTAWVLDRLLAASDVARPWDTDRVVPIPVSRQPATEDG